MYRIRRNWKLFALLVIGGVALSGLVGSAAHGGLRSQTISFEMVRSAAISGQVNNCLPNARAHVIVHSVGPVEIMTVEATGLPPNTDFDFFVIQVPDAPFGLSWYQGDFQTGRQGGGTGVFVGRFNDETFIVAPGTAPAPVLHSADANMNPPTAPVHTFHLGLWFNSPADAVNAGCAGNTTPFNGEHNAGIQVLSTRNAPPDHGPLRDLSS